jgi:hypothetical protein
VIAKKGTPNQMFAAIGPQMARSGSPRMLKGSGRMPTAASQCGSGPMMGLKSHDQVSAVRKVGTAQGRKTMAWKSRLSGKWVFRRSASPRPSENWKKSDPKVQTSVFSSEIQNFLSAQRAR